jgi:hypothetical protein
VAVITGATGHPRLGRCAISVQNQTFANLEHIVVIDGQERAAAAMDQIAPARAGRVPLHVAMLPYPTGLNRWNAHRIYGSFPMLASASHVCFLDEDNWWEPHHVASLAAALDATREPWAFSLRNIYLQDGTFIARDECESLGWLHAVFYNDTDFLVDTSCYMIRRDIAIALSPVWNRPARPPGGLTPADRTLFRMLVENYSWGACTLQHTVNYSVGNRTDSVGADLFVRGNRAMRSRYPDGLPWTLRTPVPGGQLPWRSTGAVNDR